MNRARATALALVNWKGVFYERYLLDRHVTALEGANGAGKTTVMIAAYVVLLPDLSRLRFTNLGESGATGGDKGIWGRLGELGRPSYAALELEMPGGERLVAGIQLERKAEPSLELTPFLVSGVQLDGRLKEMLLLVRGEHDEVPSLAELKENVARLGGKMEVFQTTKDYFSCLFERGITPLRLATDEDRNKLNEMLRTSMTGGISRALTSELRSFLLKEETGLSDTLSRMRANLDACHRTRTEVGEARRLEHEISAVYDAGQAMFTAALLATSESAEEAVRRVEEVRTVQEDALRQFRELDSLAREVATRQEGMAERLSTVRAAYDQSLKRKNDIILAHDLGQRLIALDHELSPIDAEANRTRSTYDAAATDRSTKKLDRDQARDAYDRAAHGLGNLQSGLDELHRNAHAYRHVRARLEEARERLGDPTIDETRIDGLLEEIREERATLDLERARLDRDVENAAARREEYALACASLGNLLGTEIDAEHPYEQARRVLSELADRDALIRKAPELERELERERELETRQIAARGRAAQLGVDVFERPGIAGVREELSRAEAELKAAEEEARREDTAANDAHRAAAEARKRVIALTARTTRHAQTSMAQGRLEAFLETPVRLRDAASAARRTLGDRRVELTTQVRELKHKREDRLRAASALEASGGVFHPEVLRLRDELEGDLLAGRFEDLDLTEAARMEAILGPLASAIIVEDPAAAAQTLVDQKADIDNVWLVDAHADLRLLGLDQGPHSPGELVVVMTPGGTRLSRLPQNPTLGRRARERQAAELRLEADRLSQELESSLERLRQLEGLIRDADTLLEDPSLEAPDPAEDLVRNRQDAERSFTLEQEARNRQELALQRAAIARPQVDALRALLGEAFLLEPPDHGELAAQLSQTLSRAAEAREELRQKADDRSLLSELAEALRRPPPTDAELSAVRAQQTGLDQRRDQLFRAFEALREVAENRHALGYADVERALQDQINVVPALEAQHALLRIALENQESALEQAEIRWELAASAWQHADAARQALLAHRERLEKDMNLLGVLDPSQEAVAAATQAVLDREAERTTLEVEERALAGEFALRQERRAQSARQVDRVREQLEAEENEAKPAAERWTRLSQQAETHGLLRSGFTPKVFETYVGRGSANLWPEARSKSEVLLDRIAGSRGGAESAAQIRAALEDEEQSPGSRFMTAWLHVRDWLRNRLPAQVADVADPLEALERLRDHLAVLEERVTRQENDLRGASEDVARGIEVQIRKAKAQVRRLNQNLTGVRFGSIVGIRVQMRRVERMDQVLRALREGAVQELLFQPTLPIEDALDEIFRRYGGGRTGGQRILDYREYIELGVEIQRHVEKDWESASPTRLSTGEAIGVGAALMMVVLTEWERDANLLRAKRAAGSLRFLFLDEANRLSQDNLGVLFDLCQNLDLQLLIAAPEVARAEGNTTYRLIRRVDEDGREEVIVSGRKAVLDPTEPAETEGDSLPSPPESAELQPTPAPLLLFTGPEGSAP